MDRLSCSKCGYSNSADSSFCIKCGNPLQTSAGINQDVQAEIKQLRSLLNQINDRLDRLENKHPVPSQPVVPLQSEQRPVEQPIPLVPPERPAPFIKPVSQGPAAVTGTKKPRKETEWEQILGGNWLARIGILALIIGIGFFLKYAFDNNWIGPTTRVLLGSAAGFVMLWLGFYWRKRYPVLTQVLSGGGIAVFYLSIFASSSTYNLINIYIATLLLLALSVLATLLALHYNSIALSIIGIFGAYFAPFILGAFNINTGMVSTISSLWLMIYIIVVGLGVIVLSSFRNRRWLVLPALGCSLLSYGFWQGEYNTTLNPIALQAAIAVIFAIFYITTLFYHVIQRRKPQTFDFIFLALNAFFFVIFTFSNLWDKYEGWMGFFFLLLAMLYWMLYFLLIRHNKENITLARIALFTGLISATIAIPVQFQDGIWTPILFALEMMAGIWLSFILKLSFLRYFSYLVFLVMCWDLLLFNTSLPSRNITPVLNERFLVYIIGIASAYISLYLVRRKIRNTGEWPFNSAFFIILANFLTLWLVSFEVWDAFGGAINSASGARENSLMDARNLSLTGAWAVCAVIGLVTGIWRHWRWVRIGSLGLLAITIIKVFAYDVFQLETSYRIAAFVGLGVLLLASAYLYQRYRKRIKGVFTGE
jgi:uncharacterized membrane protein